MQQRFDRSSPGPVKASKLTSMADTQAQSELLLVAASSISSTLSLSSVTAVRPTCVLIIWNLEAWPEPGDGVWECGASAS